ncbi:hypothetical protein HDU76_001876 [Blyttiomyces sp. JEL0837]|nr:hypothetical protein HDU76_001876 [Blyttiomyces sp. JEL0837]
MAMDLNDQVNSGASSSRKKHKLPDTPSSSSSPHQKRKMISDRDQDNYEELKQERRMLNEQRLKLSEKLGMLIEERRKLIEERRKLIEERRKLIEERLKLNDKISSGKYKKDQIEAIERGLERSAELVKRWEERIQARLTEITQSILQMRPANSQVEHISDQGSSRPSSKSSSQESSVSTKELQDPKFTKAVMDRDTKCIITGEPPFWCEATHIVPLEYWTENNMTLSFQELKNKHNDVKNGLLLNAMLRRGFDKHLWTLLPEENGVYEVKVQEQVNEDYSTITVLNGKKISFDENKRNQWPDRQFLLDHNKRFEKKASDLKARLLKAGLLKAGAEFPFDFEDFDGSGHPGDPVQEEEGEISNVNEDLDALWESEQEKKSKEFSDDSSSHTLYAVT